MIIRNKEIIEQASILHADLSGKTVLLRSCLNVSMSKDGQIIDNLRLIESLPTIRYCLKHAKQTVIIAHLGRPKEKTPDTSLKAVALALEHELWQEVFFAENLQSETMERILSRKDAIVLIENIRYFPEEDSKETETKEQFAKKLASLADFFVNDAFADYRKSVSTYELAKVLPSFLGLTFLKEVQMLSKVASRSETPRVAIVWWSKLSEKLLALEWLLAICDRVIIWWAMAATLLKAQWKEIWLSKHEPDKIDVAKDLLSRYGDRIIVPVDFALISTFADPKDTGELVYSDVIAAHQMTADIWPKSIELFSEYIASSKTIIRNGPVGIYEWEATRKGSEAIARTIISNPHSFSLSGGGDCLTLINMLWLWSKFSHLCTGGGAMLSWFADEQFPILDIILKQYEK
jgi:phosphoglycerate kinase